MLYKDLYQRFLADPKAASLAPDVSLIYIPTTTQVDGADAVFNHLTRQSHVLQRKSQTVLDAVEGDRALSLDVDTTVEFLSGGGPYLLALDDNFLADRVATFPTIHIVRFNSQNQIQSVRIYWDQGSLLKQVEVIGARGRVWPIRDAKDQIRLLKAAAAATPAATNTTSDVARPSSSSADSAADPSNKLASPGKRHIKDPYASESLFDLLSPSKDGKDREQPFRAPRAPASAKPPPREYNELFVGDDNDNDDVPDPTPSKPRAVAPKIGAGKHYTPSRIFEEDPAEPSATPVAPKAGAGKNYRESRIFDDDETVREKEGLQQIAYRAHPKRFDHFDIGADNSSREIKPSVTARPQSAKGAPQWTFEDFATPEKPRRQPRGEEVRHFGWSDDEPDLQDSPPAKPRVVQPRRDAETHFQMADKIEDTDSRRIISSFQNRGKTLYTDPLYNEDEDEEVQRQQTKKNNQADSAVPLSVVHNGPNRRKDFEPHWEVTDDIPAPTRNNKPNTQLENQKPVASDRQKAVKMMEASWEAYDESPQPSKAQTPPPHRRALRNVNQRSWGFGDE